MLENLTIGAPPRGKKPHVILSGTCRTRLPRPCWPNVFERVKIAGKNGEKIKSGHRLKGLEGAWSSPFQASLPYYYVVRAWGWAKPGWAHKASSPTLKVEHPPFFHFFKQEIFHFSTSSKIISTEWRGLL